METLNSKELTELSTQARPGMQVLRMATTPLGWSQLMTRVAWRRDCGSGGGAEGRKLQAGSLTFAARTHLLQCVKVSRAGHLDLGVSWDLDLSAEVSAGDGVSEHCGDAGYTAGGRWVAGHSVQKHRSFPTLEASREDV